MRCVRTAILFWKHYLGKGLELRSDSEVRHSSSFSNSWLLTTAQLTQSLPRHVFPAISINIFVRPALNHRLHEYSAPVNATRNDTGSSESDTFSSSSNDTTFSPNATSNLSWSQRLTEEYAHFMSVRKMRFESSNAFWQRCFVDYPAAVRLRPRRILCDSNRLPLSPKYIPDLWTQKDFFWMQGKYVKESMELGMTPLLR